MNSKFVFIAAALLLVAGSAFAGTGPSKVSNTPHNLSYWGYPGQSNGFVYNALNIEEDQICVYCHTPHGGTLDAPLWNRDLGALAAAGVTFTHYSSTSMLSPTGGSGRAVGAESLICLSCHDGSVAVGDSVVNPPSATGTPSNNRPTERIVAGTRPGPKTGTSLALLGAGSNATGDLTDDHPISMSYSAAQAHASNAGDLQTVAAVEGTGMRLFGANKNVECATCHDPHVNYRDPANAAYDPFLAIPNTGSNMCLACHIK